MEIGPIEYTVCRQLLSPYILSLNGNLALQNNQPISDYPIDHPRHVPSNVDDATMDPISDEEPSTRHSRRLSKHQMKKAREGLVEDHQPVTPLLYNPNPPQTNVRPLLRHLQHS